MAALEQAQTEYQAAKADYDAKLANYNTLFDAMRNDQTYITRSTGACDWRRGGEFPESQADDPWRRSEGDCGWRKDRFFKLYGKDGTDGEVGSAQRLLNAAKVVLDLKQKQLDEAIRTEEEIKLANLTPAEKLDLQRTTEADAAKRRTNRTILGIIIAVVVIGGIIFLIRTFRKK